MNIYCLLNTLYIMVISCLLDFSLHFYFHTHACLTVLLQLCIASHRLLTYLFLKIFSYTYPIFFLDFYKDFIFSITTINVHKSQWCWWWQWHNNVFCYLKKNQSQRQHGEEKFSQVLKEVQLRNGAQTGQQPDSSF